MKKILILSHSCELGGAERSMIDLFDYWEKKGLVEPYFIVRRPHKNMIPELKKRGWKYSSLYYTNWSQRNPSKRAEDVFRNARTNARAVNEIKKISKKVNPDLVMTNTIVSPWAAIAASFMGLPHAWFVREYGDIDHKHIFELGREKMLEDIDSLSDMVITNSDTLSSHVIRYVDKAKVSVLYTPFDLDKLERKSKEKAKNPFSDSQSLKLVITGRISPSKGQDEAAKAVGELNKKGYPAELCVIGTPSDPLDAEPLKKTILKYGIEDKVHMVGHQGNPLAILMHADVGIMASQQEAFGRVTFEYMTTGRPVVGANSGATPELIVDGVTGFLYEKGKTETLVKQLIKYAKSKELIKKHGDSAKKRAKEMMRGEKSADALFDRLNNDIFSAKQRRKRFLNFSEIWINYPLVAQRYIDESKTISLRRVLKYRIRARLKWLYLGVTSRISRIFGG